MQERPGGDFSTFPMDIPRKIAIVLFGPFSVRLMPETVAPIAIHFAAILAAAATVALLASRSGHELVGIERDNE